MKLLFNKIDRRQKLRSELEEQLVEEMKKRNEQAIKQKKIASEESGLIEKLRTTTQLYETSDEVISAKWTDWTGKCAKKFRF